MLDYYNVSEKFGEVCEWYDGYLFGNTEIFNPWTVINYISDKCFPKAFWQSTGSNEIIGEIIASATPEITENLHRLLCGQNITTYVDTSVIYAEVQNKMKQIEDKKYDTELLDSGVVDIVKTDIAFCGKSAVVKSKSY